MDLIHQVGVVAHRLKRRVCVFPSLRNSWNAGQGGGGASKNPGAEGRDFVGCQRRPTFGRHEESVTGGKCDPLKYQTLIRVSRRKDSSIFASLHQQIIEIKA